MMKMIITNFVLNKLHKLKVFGEGRTIRANRVRKFKKKSKGISLFAQIVAIWYLSIFAGTYLTSETGAYFNDVETISETIAAADNYCADPEWAKEHKKQCKDNSGIGNGCEPGDDCDTEKGEDEDNPGQNDGECGDHTSAPCSEGAEVTDIMQTAKSNSINLTWTNPSDKQFDSIKIYRNDGPSPIVKDIKDAEFEDLNLSPSMKYTYKIVTVGKNGKDLGAATIEITTKEAEIEEEPSEEETPIDTEVAVPPPGEISNLNWSEKGNSGNIEISWTQPSYQGYSHTKIYRDNILIIENMNSPIYAEKTSEKKHIYKITTVDSNGNESIGTEITVTVGEKK